MTNGCATKQGKRSSHPVAHDFAVQLAQQHSKSGSNLNSTHGVRRRPESPRPSGPTTEWSGPAVAPSTRRAIHAAPSPFWKKKNVKIPFEKFASIPFIFPMPVCISEWWWRRWRGHSFLSRKFFLALFVRRGVRASLIVRRHMPRYRSSVGYLSTQNEIRIKFEITKKKKEKIQIGIIRGSCIFILKTISFFFPYRSQLFFFLNLFLFS